MPAVITRMVRVTTALLLITLTGMIAACGDYPCSHANLQFGLVGFSNSEADTLVIKSFAKNSTTIIDSVPIYDIRYNRHNDTLKMGAIPSTALLESKYDYELFFPESNTTFRLTAIEEEQLYRKKNGIFGTTKEGCENHITAYRLNGQIRSVPGFNIIYLSK